MHIGFGGIAVAIAVHAESVHDIDEGDIFAVIHCHADRESGLAHCLQEIGLVSAAPGGGRGVWRGISWGAFSCFLRMDLILFQEVFCDAGILGIPVALSGIQGADALHFLGREAEIQIQVLLDVCGIGGFWECDGFLLQMPEQDDL